MTATAEAPCTLETRIRRAVDRGRLDEAFSIAIEAYGPELLGFLHALLHHEDLARELYAQLCADLWSALPRFEWRSSFRTWAYCAARNAVHRHRASAAHRRLRPLTSRSLGTLVHSERTETAPYLRTENKDRVARLRERLAPDERMLLVLRIDRDLAWDEIADVMAGQPYPRLQRARAAATIRKRFERIKERLRAMAIEEGLLSTEPG